MKIILSRKGFDSGYGGYPSPILPDGTLLSLPIPDTSSNIKYTSLTAYDNTTYSDILTQIIGDKIKLENEGVVSVSSTGCHLDPDVRFNTYRREENWTGLFGQAGAAQTHLSNKDVNRNDIFLFFGWFRKTILENGRLKYDPSDKIGKHIIFGYLQIDKIYNLNYINPEAWMKYHPHVCRTKHSKNDSIYIATKKLSWNNSLKGYGTFKYNKNLVLSKMGMSKSKWNLPEIFKDADISYHNKNSWKDGYFQSAAKGQEFVINATADIESWAKKLIGNGLY